MRLPAPHTSRASVLAAIEGADAADWEDDAHERYRFHGWVRPLPQHCQHGCTWWTYRFSDDALVSAELERRPWQQSHLLVTATLERVPDYHTRIILRVRVEDPESPQL